PIRLPTAMSRWPATEAEATIAISGSVPAIARRIKPPSASPTPKGRSGEGVDFDSDKPATQVATAPATKTTTTSGVDRPLTELAYAVMVPREVETERLLLRQWRGGDAR